MRSHRERVLIVCTDESLCLHACFCSAAAAATQTALRHRPRKGRGASRRCREHARRAMPNLAQRRSTWQRLLLWPWSGRSTWRQWIGGPRVLAGRGVGLHRHSRRIGLVGEDARQQGQQHHEAHHPAPAPIPLLSVGLHALFTFVLSQRHGAGALRDRDPLTSACLAMLDLPNPAARGSASPPPDKRSAIDVWAPVDPKPASTPPG